MKPTAICSLGTRCCFGRCSRRTAATRSIRRAIVFRRLPQRRRTRLRRPCHPAGAHGRGLAGETGFESGSGSIPARRRPRANGTSASRCIGRRESAPWGTAARCCCRTPRVYSSRTTFRRGVSLRDLGTHRLKDVERPERIWQVAAEGLPPTSRRSVERTRIRPRAAAAPPRAAPARSPGSSLPRWRCRCSRSRAARAARSPPDPGGDDVGSVSACSNRVSLRLVGQAAAARPGSITAGAGSIWVAMGERAIVARSTRSREHRAADDHGRERPSGDTVGGGFVWVANSLGGTVSKIDPKTRRMPRCRRHDPVGNGPCGVASGPDAVWVANSTDRTVTEIDPVTDAHSRTLPGCRRRDGIAVGYGASGSTRRVGRDAEPIDPRARSSPSRSTSGGGRRGRGRPGRGLGREPRRRHREPDRSGDERPSAHDPVGAGPSGIAARRTARRSGSAARSPALCRRSIPSRQGRPEGDDGQPSRGSRWAGTRCTSPCGASGSLIAAAR